MLAPVDPRPYAGPTDLVTAAPYLLDGPTCVSFSGGRTSAYMLRRILDAHGGALPADAHVVFANTGKERPETLDFVQACATAWNVRVRWIEAHITETETGLAHGWREVDHATASRDGEPFAALIRARKFLPNPVMRFCTQELKIRPMKKFARSVGFDHWTNVVGLRADEPRRVAKANAPTKERYELACPLARDGVTVERVRDFWARQSFNLQLESHEGNCDLCFLKGRAKLERIMRDRPGLAEWWIAQESAGTFRKDRPTYRRMLTVVQNSPHLPGFDDEGTLPCACTD